MKKEREKERKREKDAALRQRMNEAIMLFFSDLGVQVREIETEREIREKERDTERESV